jgi:hypothetical protein
MNDHSLLRVQLLAGRPVAASLVPILRGSSYSASNAFSRRMAESQPLMSIRSTRLGKPGQACPADAFRPGHLRVFSNHEYSIYMI